MVQFSEFGKGPIGLASVTGGIHDETHVSGVLGERSELFARGIEDREAVNRVGGEIVHEIVLKAAYVMILAMMRMAGSGKPNEHKNNEKCRSNQTGDLLETPATIRSLDFCGLFVFI